jgi:hypothetical protein
MRITVFGQGNRIGVDAPEGFASNAEFVKSRTAGPTANGAAVRTLMNADGTLSG